MRSSAARAFGIASKSLQNNAQVTASVHGTASSIPAYIVPAAQSTSEAAYIDEQELIEPEESRRRRSQEAEDGSARIGMVELPTELQLAVNRLMEGEAIRANHNSLDSPKGDREDVAIVHVC